MAAVSSFEVLCAPDVFARGVFCCGGLVNYIEPLAVSYQWTFVFFAFLAVAWFDFSFWLLRTSI